MNIKVSVIIPVFNAEKYILECIESLINQTLSDCEFIFVNDGSEDSGRKIIEHYQNIDLRIKLINQENQGVSVARNNGLNIATGEYVGFVDADDFIEKDMYEKLYQAATIENYDAVISNFEIEIEGHATKTHYLFPENTLLNKEYIQNQILPHFLKSDNLNSVCNKLFKNKLIKDYDLTFPDHIELGEDGLFNMRFFCNSDNVVYINYSGYFYREVLGSATRNIAQKDYFSRSLEVYGSKIPLELSNNIKETTIQKYRACKLINSVLSYIHIYLTPSKNMSFRNRVKYVKKMLSNNSVREALPLFNEENYHTLGNYERTLVKMMQNKNLIGIYLITAYSRFRNK